MSAFGRFLPFTSEVFSRIERLLSMKADTQ